MTLWPQFLAVSDSDAARKMSKVIYQAVLADEAFRGTPLATVPRPIDTTDINAALLWKYALWDWLRSLPDELVERFKKTETLPL